MQASLAAAGAGGVWLVSSDIKLDYTTLTGATVSKWSSTPTLFVLRFVGEQPEVQQAIALEAAGKNAEAKVALENYMRRVGGPAAAHGVAFYAGVVASKVGDLAFMERMYDAIGNSHLDNLQVLYNWGLVKLYVKKPQEAVIHLERASAMAKDDLSVQINLADAYAGALQKAKARSIVERLSKLYPQDPNVARKLKEFAN